MSKTGFSLILSMVIAVLAVYIINNAVEEKRNINFRIENSVDCEYACDLKNYDYFGYDKFADDLKCICSRNGALRVVK